MKTTEMSTVTPLEHTAIGGLGGAIEMVLMQPMLACKNALQEGRPIPRNPIHLYRGLGIGVVSMAPITASQFGTNRLMQQVLSGPNNQELSGASKFASAAVAGAVSAFIASPTELVVIQQQKSGRPLVAELQHFLKTHGVLNLSRGIVPAIGRETLYAAGYLGLAPILQDILEKSPALKDYPAGTSLAIAGLTGGVFAAICSHPFDTSKTRMQAFMYSRPEYMTLSRTVATIYKEGGLLTFWKGLAPRMARIIAATYILTYTRNTAVAYLDNARAPPIGVVHSVAPSLA